MVFIWSLLIGGLLQVSAQEVFSVGIHAGLPMAESKDVSTLNLGAELTYRNFISDRIALGATTGYTRFFGKDEEFFGLTIEHKDFSFIPLAFSAKGLITEQTFLSADLGYAFGLEDFNDDGFYYKGKLGWTNSDMDIFIYYQTVTLDNGDASALGAGISFAL